MAQLNLATLAALTAVFGGIAVLVKAFPERSKTIIDAQAEALESLRIECDRLRKRIVCLEKRLRTLEGSS